MFSANRFIHSSLHLAREYTYSSCIIFTYDLPGHLMVHVHVMWELHYLPTFADFSLFTFSISSWKCNFYHTWPLRLPHHSLLDSASNSLIFLLTSIPCPHSFTKNKFKCKKGKTALHVLPQEWCGKRINERKKIIAISFQKAFLI